MKVSSYPKADDPCLNGDPEKRASAVTMAVLGVIKTIRACSLSLLGKRDQNQSLIRARAELASVSGNALFFNRNGDPTPTYNPSSKIEPHFGRVANPKTPLKVNKTTSMNNTSEANCNLQAATIQQSLLFSSDQTWSTKMRATTNHKVVPERIRMKPRPEVWGEDELLSLTEAVALYWPDGPISVCSLRHMIHAGQLKVSVIGRRHLVTPRALRALSDCKDLREKERREPRGRSGSAPLED